MGRLSYKGRDDDDVDVFQPCFLKCCSALVPRFPATHVYPLPMHNPDPSALDHVGGGGVLMLIIMLYRASVSDVNDDSE